jgi:dTDP-glucose 4,6-dehydratase
MTESPLPTALVAGGAGFIGSHFCERLLKEGFRVICVDNLITGRMENIAHLLDHPTFLFIEHDVSEPFDLESLLAKSQDLTPSTRPLRHVAHLASPASPKDYQRYPIETLRAGAQGTYNLLELALQHRARFLLASTSEVYGDPEVHPQPESYWGHVNPVGPRSCYDEAKRFAEALTMAYHRQHGLDVRIARIFNTYGPRMRLDDGRLLPTFMAQALRNEPLTVYGDGTQTRSLCYIDDLVEGLYRLMRWVPGLSSQVPGARSQQPDGSPPTPIFNLGSPDEVRILDLAKEIIALTSSRSEIVFEPLPEDDPKVRRPDTTKAQKLLSWAPQVPRVEGLRRTLPYFQRLVSVAHSNPPFIGKRCRD